MEQNCFLKLLLVYEYLLNVFFHTGAQGQILSPGDDCITIFSHIIDSFPTTSNNPSFTGLIPSCYMDSDQGRRPDVAGFAWGRNGVLVTNVAS